MSLSDALSELSSVLETVEECVVDVETASVSRTPEGEVLAELSLRLPETETGAGPRETAADAGTTDRASRGSEPPVPPSSLHRSVGGAVSGAAGERADALAVCREETSSGPTATGGGDGDVPCRVESCGETFSTAHGMKIHAAKAHDADGASPHRDPDRLRAVYDDCETFEEMVAALDADVTAQTVRRNMIAQGIHDPDADGGEERTRANEPEDSAADEVVGTSGRDEAPDTHDPTGSGEDDADATIPAALRGELPEGVDASGVLRAVRESETLYEVTQRLDLERSVAQSLLSELGLLELVVGRVATKPEREDRKAEVERRLREGASGD